MPTLHFKGKPFLKNYHHAVKFHNLVAKKESGTNKEPSLDDNLLIQGDNLKALKALLPTHAGKIKCIYIDPPYNTGNENWTYNDNVASPMIQKWLGEVVDKDDLTRHDKWCCMMYPRLTLLRELLREDGAIFISIDDNECANLQKLLEEIFGESNFVSTYIWEARAGKDHTAVNVSVSHEYVICFAKNIEKLSLKKDERTASGGNYEDEKGNYRREQLRQWGTHDTRKDRPTMFYTVTAPDGTEILPYKDNGIEGCWRVSKERMTKMIEDGDVDFIKNGEKYQIYAKKRDGKITKTAYGTLLQGVGTSSTGTIELKDIFGEKVFDTPKPTSLIKYLMGLIIDKEAIILDSFAGSGTTGHAVLALNKEDGGNRKFILVECEDYADKITAERLRRIVKGVSTASDESLKEGLGGNFSYFQIGDAVEIDTILEGKNLPTYEELAKYVFFTATGERFDAKKMNQKNYHIGSSSTFEVYLIYEPNKEKLKKLSLNLDFAQEINNKNPNRQKLVFAPCCFIEEFHLKEHGIRFAQLPFEIYRIAE